MEKLLICLLMIGLILAIGALKQEIFSPAVLNVFWNIFFILGAVIFFGGEIEWEYGGIIWTLGTCGAFLFGQTLGQHVGIKNRTSEFIKGKKNYVYIIVVGVIALGLVETLIYLHAFQYSVFDLFNIRALLELNTKVAYDRYYGHTFNPPAISTILSIIIYMGAIIGGYVFVLTQKFWGKFLCILTLIPILFLAIVTNAKVGVIASVFLWVIGWMLCSFKKKKTGKLLNKKVAIMGICVAVLGIAFLDLTMLMRIGSIDMKTQMIVNNKLQEYAFGQVDAFSKWFACRETNSLELGSNTYMFFTNWLGITERKQGVYDLLPGVVSNIFTQNRGIVMDYGVIGGFLYWLGLGVLSGAIYKKVKNGSRSIIATVILGAIYFQVLYGFIISPWIYSSYVLAFVGFGIFLLIIEKCNFKFKR